MSVTSWPRAIRLSAICAVERSFPPPVGMKCSMTIATRSGAVPDCEAASSDK